MRFALRSRRSFLEIRTSGPPSGSTGVIDPPELGPCPELDWGHAFRTCFLEPFTVTPIRRIKPSRREKYWVSDAGTGVAHPLFRTVSVGVHDSATLHGVLW